MLSGNPVLTINCGVDLIPQVNVREIVCLVMGKTLSLAYLGTSLTFLCSTIFNAFASQCVLFDDADLSCDRRGSLVYNLNTDVYVLDFSNPFLHACKTKGLRE